MANPIPLDQQGLSCMAMPDPYGLQEWNQSILPDSPSTSDIMEALELWKFPQEAYPQSKKRFVECTWYVEREAGRFIAVHLRRQVFVSRPSPFWPSKDDYQLGDGFGKSYFSFWASWQFEIGPVVRPMPPGTYDAGHRGYNHVSAELAWGEAKILAGRASKDFVLQWSANFKLEMAKSFGRTCPYPPVLKQFVWHIWPDIARQFDTWDTTNWDWELLQLNHQLGLGVAALDASLDAEQPDPELPAVEHEACTIEAVEHEACTIEDNAAQEFEAVEHEACTIEDNDDVDLEDQEQLPDLEALYESDWLPVSIPDAGDIQHQSAHDDMYQIPESWEWVRAPPCKRSRGQIPFSEMEHVD